MIETIETPEAMEADVLWARSQADARRRTRCCITAAEQASMLTAGHGWPGWRRAALLPALSLSSEQGPQILQGGMPPELLLHLPQGVAEVMRPPRLGCSLFTCRTAMAALLICHCRSGALSES